MGEITVKLSKFDNQPWGFRLQGGVDFSAPLSISKVNGGSLAETAGLMAGDIILRIGEADAYQMRHKQAQDAIVKSGNNFEIVVQRAGGNFRQWKPQVTPVTPHMTNGTDMVATKTSLAAPKQDYHHVGSGHNVKPKPFASGPGTPCKVLPGAGDGVMKAIVNKQFNSPVGLYSEESIAETLSAQTEVLASGVLGVNFKKNEKEYSLNQSSEVLKMVQEMDSGPRDLHEAEVPHEEQSVKVPPSHPVITSVKAPEPSAHPPPSAHVTNETRCAECDRIIYGVYVLVNKKYLHTDCFKCATCGTLLKQEGYYSINDKLYCGIHARQIAKAQSQTSSHDMATSLSTRAAPVGPMSSYSPAITPKFSPAQFPGSHAHNVSSCIEEMVSQSHKYESFSQSMETQSLESHLSVLDQSSEDQTISRSLRPLTAGSSAHKPVPGTAPSSLTTSSGRKGGSKFVWPPPKQPEEDVHLCPGPTATPVYNVPGGTPITVEPSLVPKITPSFQSKSPAPSSSPSSASSAYVPAPIISPSFSNMPFASNEPPSDPTSIPSHVADVGGKQSMGISSPRRGKGVLNPQAGPGARIPVCAATGKQIRGPFLTALGKTWSPEHFVCSMDTCRRSLMDTGFVEENNKLYCESCFQQHLAPVCCKCQKRIPGDCLRAIGQHYHPECFTCAHCSKPFGTNNYFLEDGLAYCETDWTAMFTTKCFGCKFPIEAGDRWVEALNNNYHSQCFKCSMCGTLLEGQSFFAKGGRPFCRNHARA